MKLNAKSVIQGKDTERTFLWQSVFQRSLNRDPAGVKYMCIASKSMVGCLILVFTKETLQEKFTYIRTTKIKTGFGGQSGNKGAVGVRFNFNDSSFLFVNGHLTSGMKNTQQRLDDLREIKNRCF